VSEHHVGLFFLRSPRIFLRVLCMIENVWNGLLLGALYLACGRNLAVPVIAHAVGDTLDFILIYLGKYPGMR